MLNSYNGGTQLGIQHQHQPPIQPPQLPQPSSSSLSSSQLGQGIMSMSMSGQQPQPQGQNLPSNMQNPHPLPHQLPHGHLQSQRGVMITPQHPHQQPRGFPPGGSVGAGPGPGSGLMPNPNSNTNPNATTAAGMYPHGSQLQQGARRIPNAPGPGPNSQPPTSVMGGIMGLQMPMQQHPHHPHMPQHGIPPNQQLPPHLNSQQQQQQQIQQQSQQPPHLAHQGQQPSHLGQQNMNVNNMNINNALQHPSQAQAQQSNTGLPPSIAGQLRQGGPNARMLANHGPPPGGGNGQGGSGGGIGDMGMGGMGMPAMGMGGLSIPVGMGRGQHQSQLGPQTVNGVTIPTVMGRGGGQGGGGPTASGMRMMNLGMGIPQPQGHPSGAGTGIPHRAPPQSQPQTHQQPLSQNQPFNLGAQSRPPSSQQQATVNPQQSGQQPPLSFNPPSHVQPPGHGNIHSPVPFNAAGNSNPNAGGAPSPNRPPAGTPGAMGALRGQGPQTGQQTASGSQHGQAQAHRLSAGPGTSDIMSSFAQLHQHHQQQQRQMMMGMGGGAGMNEFGTSGPSGGGAGNRVGIQHPTGGGYFIPDPQALTSNFPGGTGAPGAGPNATSGVHHPISKPNQPGGHPNSSPAFSTIPHPQPGPGHHPQGLQQQHHPHAGPAGLGPGIMPMGQQIGQQHQPQETHPRTPHLGTAGVGIQRGGPHPHPHSTQPHGQLLQGRGSHSHPQLSGTPGPSASTPNANTGTPTMTRPGSGIGSGPNSVMIPHPNTGPGPSDVNVSTGPGSNGRPPNRVGMGTNMNMGATNMGMSMNMGMGTMFGSSNPGGDIQARGQTPNPNGRQGTPIPAPRLPTQSPRQSQQVPAPGQGSGHSRTTPRPPSRHHHSSLSSSPNIIPHHAQPGAGPVGMGMGRGPPGPGAGVPLPLPNAGPGSHPMTGPSPPASSTSPQVRRTSLPPGVISGGEGGAVGPPGAITTGPGGIPPHPPHIGVLRPPIPIPSVVGSGQGLVRVLSFSGAINAECEERRTRNHWNKLVNEYFAPHSSWKLTLWRDNERREAKLFDICPEVIAMFFAVSAQAGVKSMNFILDNVQERPIHWGVSVVECSEARWIWRFTDGHTVVLKGVFSAQVTAYHNPASTTAGGGGTGGPNALNGPPGVTSANNTAGGANGPTPGTPRSVGTPHSPHISPQQSIPQPNQPPYILKFDSMVFDSFVHDKLLNLDCILGLRIPYASSSLAPGNSGMSGLSDSPRTQGHKTTPATTTQGSPDIAPASTSSSSSGSAGGLNNNPGPNGGNGPAIGTNVKMEEHQGQTQVLMQGQNSGSVSQGQGFSQGGQGPQTYPQGPMTQSPSGNMNGGSGSIGFFDERLVIEQAIIPSEPINAFGIPQASMRCLELAESVGQMTELFRFSRERDLGPEEALQALANQIKQYGIGPGSMMGGSMNVMGGNMGPMGMVSGGANGGLIWMNGSGGTAGRPEGRHPASSSLGPGEGLGQPPQPYGFPQGLYGPPPPRGAVVPQGQGQLQPQSQAQQPPQQSQFQSQSQAHTPQSAQHTPQLTQLTKPLGQLPPQNQNQIQNPTVTRSPRHPSAQTPSTPKHAVAGTPNTSGGGGASNKTTGGAPATGATGAGGGASGQGTASTAMKRKAPDTSNMQIGQNDTSQPPAKRVTRRKSKAG